MAKDHRTEALSILKAVLALGRRLRAERPRGAAPLSALSILGTLHRLGPIPATRLAAEERLQPQSLTRILSSLEKDGLIERTRNGADRREITIALTERGRRLLVEDIRAREAWLEDAMAAALNESECDLLFAASEAMLKLAFHSASRASKKTNPNLENSDERNPTHSRTADRLARQ